MSPAALAPANPPAAPCGVPTRALTERQMARLERLAEIGMEIAEAAGRAARGEGEGAPGVQGADPGLIFSRAARAVRLTIALQCRLTEAAAAQDQARTRARSAEAAGRRDRVHRRIERVAEAERHDGDEVEALSSAAWERLTETEDDDVLDAPVEALVARICRDLGLGPEWAAAFAAPQEADEVEDAASVGEGHPPAGLWPEPGGGPRGPGPAPEAQRAGADPYTEPPPAALLRPPSPGAPILVGR